MIDRILVAHVMLTRFPLRIRGDLDDERLRRAAVGFPLVGLSVGAIAALARLAADGLGSDVAALCALAAASIVTGALHEDGLADTADALGARQPKRRLEVMRDPRVGSFGVLALVVVLLGRLLLLGGLELGQAAAALVAAHVLARWSVLPQAALIAPARREGSGALLGSLPMGTLVAGSALAVAASAAPLASIDVSALLALPLAAVIACGCACAWRRAFGGVTGDTHGATAQLVELATYACIVGVV